MAAPASAAATAASAISFGVTGKWGDIDGVWIEPVMAHVMITLRDFAMACSSFRVRCDLVPAQRKKPPIALPRATFALRRRERCAKCCDHLLDVVAFPHGRRGWIRSQRSVEAAVTRTIIADAA